MHDFRIALLGNQFEFHNIENLLHLLEERTTLFPEELQVALFHCDVLVPQPYGRPMRRQSVKLRSLLVDLDEDGLDGEPQVRYTALFKVDTVESVAGTQLFEIALHFMEDGTYFGYDLPTAFAGTALLRLELELRFFEEEVRHRPVEQELTVN